MQIAIPRALVLATAGSAALLGADAVAQSTAQSAIQIQRLPADTLGADAAVHPAARDARFAPPVRIRAGDAFAGEGRYYPSPVLHDIDGDGRQDLVIGDLVGAVTVARRDAGDAPTFAAEQPLKGKDGQPLKFHNW